MADELQARLNMLEAENIALRAQHEQVSTQSKLETAAAMCRVAVKLPPFWSDRVTVWFAQAEAQFLLAGINTDVTKYSYVLSQIDHKVAGEIEDIVINPPAEGKYQTLKETLIKRFSISEEQRVRQLLGDEELGDRKPSQFLRHLRSIAGTTLSDDNILRQLWVRRLPLHAQGILAAQADLSLDRIADIADKIIEAQPSQVNVFAATGTPTLNSLLERIDELGNQIAALKSDRSRTRSRQSSRNSTPDRTEKRCWYHRKYGTKAKKCISPCNWLAENPRSSQ